MRAASLRELEGNDFTVVRLSRDLRNRSSVGFIATDRRAADSDSQSFGVDGSLGLGANAQLRAFAARTATSLVDDGDHAYALFGSYNSATWQLNGRYSEVGAGFDPQVGFVTRRDYRSVTMFAGRTLVDTGTLREWQPFVTYEGYWDFDGYHESGNLHLESWWTWKNGADIWPALNVSREGVKHPFDIAGVVVPAGEYETRDFELGIGSATNTPWSTGAHIVAGGLYSGKRLTVSPYLNYHRGETLSAWAGWDHNTIDLGSENGPFSVNLARAGFSYSFAPKINFRVVVQYNDADNVLAANVRFSWLRSANAGLYVVYNEIDARHGLGRAGREFVLKYSRVFDVF